MRKGSQPFHHQCFMSHLHGLGVWAWPHSMQNGGLLRVPALQRHPLEGTAPADHRHTFNLPQDGLIGSLGGNSSDGNTDQVQIKIMSTLKNTNKTLR